MVEEEVLDAPIVEETPALDGVENNGSEESQSTNEEAEKGAVDTAAEEVKDPKDENKPTEQPQELTEEEKALAYLKSQGVLVEKIADLIPKVEETEEQIRQANLAKDNLLLQKHIEKGKDIELFTEVKKLTTQDPIKLGIEVVKKDLSELNYTEEQIEQIIKNKYFQFSDEELEYMDEDDIEAAKANKAYYDKELATKGNVIIQDAKNYLGSLQGEIDNEANIKKYDADIDAAIVEQASKLQKVQSFELKELNEKLGLKELSVELDEAVVKELTESYANKEFRNKLFNKTDGELIARLYELETTVASIPKMLEQAALKGAVTQTQKMTESMPKDPKQLFANSVSGGAANVKQELHDNRVQKGSLVVKNI